VGANVSVGHGAIIHGATVGDNTIIGMGATLLNRSRIGKNSIVGANALIPEGKEFPDNSLIVGSPARAVRTLDDEAVASIRRSAENYIENWKRFSKDLEVIEE